MGSVNKYLVVGASSEVGITLIRDILSGKGNTTESGERMENLSILAHYAHSDEALMKLKEEFPDVDITLAQADLGSMEDTERFIGQIAEWGCPDAVVYLPASKFEYMRVKGLSWEKIEKELEIAVRGFALICKAVLPLMSKQKYGKVVVMLTEYTLGMPPRFMSHYVTAKYALLGFMKAMASEYGDKGININGISPAMMDTKFLENIDERIIAMNAESNVMKRHVKVEEVVSGIRFLLSEGSDYISGVNMNMSGGNR